MLIRADTGRLTMSMRLRHFFTFAAPLACVLLVSAQGQTPAGQTPASPTPRAAEPIDLTGQWVSLITEDWRYRMVTPTRGDYQSVPMTQAAIREANAWDPKADEAAGLQCKSYGAAAIMHVAGRFRFTWENDRTLRLDTDNGMQTRLFHFDGSAAGAGGQRTWQGNSVATWETGARGRGLSAAPAGAGGSLKVVTTNMRSGYLRKNGVPYGEKAV